MADARQQYIKLKTPVKIGRKVLDPEEAVHIAVIEAFLLYLGRTKLLRKLVKFDYKD
jgi:hypothetical protein